MFFLEDGSNIADKKTLQHTYETATENTYNFLCVNFMNHAPNEIFKINFEKKKENE